MSASPPGLSLKARALRHLARREHSRIELERKLLSRWRADQRAGRSNEPQAAADAPPRDDEVGFTEQLRKTLDELSARGLLSDARAAESLLLSHGRRFGSRRLKQTLQAKGLDPELVRSTVQQSRATEYERAQDLWRRRFGQPPADAKEQARQMRFLAGRGFDGDIIRRIVKSELPSDQDS